ncbi:hypothetical protein QW131_15595 [Roseibium salinum]|nr:hypothetical protein [Roseibium salinum]
MAHGGYQDGEQKSEQPAADRQRRADQGSVEEQPQIFMITVDLEKNLRSAMVPSG